MHAVGVLVNLHYIPVYRQPFYEQIGFLKGYCAEAEQYFTTAMSLPMYPGLTVAQQRQVVSGLRAATEA